MDFIQEIRQKNEGIYFKKIDPQIRAARKKIYQSNYKRKFEMQMPWVYLDALGWDVDDFQEKSAKFCGIPIKLLKENEKFKIYEI